MVNDYSDFGEALRHVAAIPAGAEQSFMTRVETGRSAEVVLGVCELVLPPEPLRASFGGTNAQIKMRPR